MKLEVKCRNYDGELISIKPDLYSTYPDGERRIETYKIKLRTICGDDVTVRNVFKDDIVVTHDAD